MNKQATSPQKQRDVTLDVAKGVLIILIVLGHSQFPHNSVVYWFHVPGFFIISGLLYRSRSLKIKKLAISLFVPMAVYALIDIAIRVYANSNLQNTGSVLDLVYRHMLSGKFIPGVFWFVPVFFMARVVYTYAEQILRRYVWVFILICFAAAQIVSIYFITDGVDAPSRHIRLAYKTLWNVDVVLLALYFIFVGHMLKKYYPALKSLKVFAALTGACVAFVVARHFLEFSYTLDVKYTYYKNPILDATVPVVFSLWSISFGWVLAKIRAVSETLSYLGRNTLPIMFLHVPVSLVLLKLRANPLLFTLVGLVVPVGFVTLARRLPFGEALFSGGRGHSKA